MNTTTYSLAAYPPIVTEAAPPTFFRAAREFLDDFTYFGSRQVVQLSAELASSTHHPQSWIRLGLKIAAYLILACFTPALLGALLIASCVSRCCYTFEVHPLEQLPVDLLQRALQLQPTKVELLLALWVLEGGATGENRQEAHDRILSFLRGNQNKFDLSDLGLSTLPDVFHHRAFQERLIHLYLDGNRLTAIPESLSSCTALKWLGLSHNQLTAIPDFLGNLSRLHHLNLDGNRLTAIPESLSNCTALRWLDLSNNQLTAIPDSLGDLTALRTLDLYTNQLTAIPDSLGNLTALDTLDLSNNRLTAIPDSIGNCTALEWLQLNHNKLDAIPDSIGNCTALKWLNLSSNKLNVIPDSLGNLVQLEELDLSINLLTAIPKSIGNCTALRILALQLNRLTDLPNARLKRCAQGSNLQTTMAHE